MSFQLIRATFSKYKMTYLNVVHSTVLLWTFLSQIVAFWNVTQDIKPHYCKRKTTILPITGLKGKTDSL